jgi:hypothetical protein
MAVGPLTVAAEPQPSSEKGFLVAVSASESDTAREDTPIHQQYDAKIVGSRVGSTLEPPAMAADVLPSTPSPPPPVKKENRPTLLKPQHKTALKDFIVSVQPTSCALIARQDLHHLSASSPSQHGWTKCCSSRQS